MDMPVAFPEDFELDAGMVVASNEDSSGDIRSDDSLFGGGDDEATPSMEEPFSVAATVASASPAFSLLDASAPSLLFFDEPLASRATGAAPDNSGLTAINVSTQGPAVDQASHFSPEDAELQCLLEEELRNGQSIDIRFTGAVLAYGDQEGHSDRDASPPILPSDANHRASKQFPRRIDRGDVKVIERLCDHLILRTSVKSEDVYRDLDLPRTERRILWTGLAAHFKNPGLQISISPRDCKDRSIKTKKFLIGTILDFLGNYDWGQKLFPAALPGTSRRRYAWPEDSTLIVYHLVPLFYRAMRNELQRRYSVNNKAKKKANAAQSDASSSKASTTVTASSDHRPDAASLPDSQFKPRQLPAYASPHTLLDPVTASPNPINTCLSPLERVDESSDVEFVSATLSSHQSAPDRKAAAHSLSPLHEQAPSPQQHEALELPLTSGGHVRSLTYTMDMMRDGKRVHPRARFPSSSVMTQHGFWMVLKRCWDMKVTGTLKVLTPEGLQTVETNEMWIAAIQKISDEVTMDGMVRIRVDLI